MAAVLLTQSSEGRDRCIEGMHVPTLDPCRGIQHNIDERRPALRECLLKRGRQGSCSRHVVSLPMECLDDTIISAPQIMSCFSDKVIDPGRGYFSDDGKLGST